MKEKQTSILGSIFTHSLEEIESIFKGIFQPEKFSKIEQGSVLLYEDGETEFSIEYFNDSFFLTGRHFGNLLIREMQAEKIANCLKEKGISYSIDYQEESTDGSPCSDEFNLSFKRSL